jgi:PAS domain S-box-containing protein
MANNPGAAIVLADPDGCIQHWNEGAALLFGHARSEAEGRSLDLILPDEFRDRHWTAFRRAMSTGVAEMDRAVLDVPVRCRGDSVQPFRARFVFLKDADERPIGAMVIFTPPETSNE